MWKGLHFLPIVVTMEAHIWFHFSQGSYCGNFQFSHAKQAKKMVVIIVLWRCSLNNVIDTPTHTRRWWRLFCPLCSVLGCRTSYLSSGQLHRRQNKFWPHRWIMKTGMRGNMSTNHPNSDLKKSEMLRTIALDLEVLIFIPITSHSIPPQSKWKVRCVFQSRPHLVPGSA